MVDLMAGTGSVAYMLKSMGKCVIANDYLHSNYSSLLAFIQNSSAQLTDDDVNWLLCHHAEVPYSSFVTETFQGFYFPKRENQWLDMVACNIAALGAKNRAETEYKKALAQHALTQVCLMKRPFNLFHRKNLYIRTARVERTFGNKTTWNTPFPILYKRIVEESNRCVFKNGRRNRALNVDLNEVQVLNADLIYIDPPYFGKGRDRAASNYRLLYHFVEGISQYDNWNNLIDHSHHLKSLKTNGYSTEDLYVCERGLLRKTFMHWLEEVLKKWPNAQVAISYKQPGIPGQQTIIRVIENTGRKVSVRRKPYSYALNHKNGTPKHNVELLFIGT